MISETNKPAEKADADNLDDSGFLTPETGSDTADADYNIDLPVSEADRTEEDDKAAERQKRIMSRIPQ
ncbi:hypothetical protein H6S82_09855 [Planktothrix sp. FACHB-1355]|uniref:Uncharacterized protein n=1 Tax=Aerosakkonema funiforme FACHB-1375 TaxID=2949571 RepID=A0A926ZFJ2_9CYAN|nr:MULTISPECIES: hypothetical protein [Oscillatoriales]MBD2180729.1 hypothetical protein [Aerosakkonema funiforme FACHB-1375]MBD3559163.1 hypothetical protein [Planktothrix sp. FACHB-1355]